MTTIVHNSPFSVAGAGFGTKPAQTPTVFHNGDNIAVGAFDGAWPTQNPAFNTAVRSVQRGIAPAHSHVNRYIAGCHYSNGGADAGYLVMFWKNRTIASFPAYNYVSWYQRFDDHWTFGGGIPADDNLKAFDYSLGVEPMNPSNWYVAWNGPPTSPTSEAFWSVNDDNGSMANPDNNGHNFFWDVAVNPMAGAWSKVEVECRLDTAVSGYIKVWENNVLRVNYSGRTDAMAGTARCEAVGGYARSQTGDTQWRYYNDVYLDYDPKRFVLTNNSNYANATIVETQRYTAYADGAVTLVCNAGKLSNGAVHLHFRAGFGGTDQYLGALLLASIADAPPPPILMPQASL